MVWGSKGSAFVEDVSVDELLQLFFLVKGRDFFFQSPLPVRKAIPPGKDAWTCKKGLP